LEGVNLKVEVITERTHDYGQHQDHDLPHPDSEPDHSRRHPEHRGYTDIKRLVENSDLDNQVKEISCAVFKRLAEAEAKVHRTTVDDVHFHEVGAIDSIVDIVGSCIGFHYFEVEAFYSSPLGLGGGTVTFSHGTWPVPAPATVELVRGFPTRIGGVDAELTTPTGAAIVTTLAEAADRAPAVCFEKSGYGAGDLELPGKPNMLRLMLGSSAAGQADRSGVADSGRSKWVQEEQILLLEASIDDMDPEMFGHFLGLALKQGALDVYYTPIQMKKNRPGLLVSLLCRPEDRDRLVELVFSETTTLGLRVNPQTRWVLEREVRSLDTEYGPVKFKVGRFGGRVVNIAPEYEDLKRISDETGLSLKRLRQELIGKIAELQS
jgi:uncharacterized protein (TIGR00299 family) protein